MKLFRIKLITTKGDENLYIIDKDKSSALKAIINETNYTINSILINDLCNAEHIENIIEFANKEALVNFKRQCIDCISDLLKHKPNDSILFEDSPGVDKIMNHVHFHALNDAVSKVYNLEIKSAKDSFNVNEYMTINKLEKLKSFILGISPTIVGEESKSKGQLKVDAYKLGVDRIINLIKKEVKNEK
jgi:hypothetical protein